MELQFTSARVFTGESVWLSGVVVGFQSIAARQWSLEVVVGSKAPQSGSLCGCQGWWWAFQNCQELPGSCQEPPEIARSCVKRAQQAASVNVAARDGAGLQSIAGASECGCQGWGWATRRRICHESSQALPGTEALSDMFWASSVHQSDVLSIRGTDSSLKSTSITSQDARPRVRALGFFFTA